MFSRSLTCFLKSENRYFVMLMRDVLENLSYIALLVTLYLNSLQIGISLSNAGMAFLIPNAVAAVWMFFLIVKIPFLDAEYRGVSRF